MLLAWLGVAAALECAPARLPCCARAGAVDGATLTRLLRAGSSDFADLANFTAELDVPLVAAAATAAWRSRPDVAAGGHVASELAAVGSATGGGGGGGGVCASAASGAMLVVNAGDVASTRRRAVAGGDRVCRDVTRARARARRF